MPEEWNMAQRELMDQNLKMKIKRTFDVPLRFVPNVLLWREPAHQNRPFNVT